MNLQMGLPESQPVTCFNFETKEKISEYSSINAAARGLGCSVQTVYCNVNNGRKLIGLSNPRGRKRKGVYSRKLDKRVFFKLKK